MGKLSSRLTEAALTETDPITKSVFEAIAAELRGTTLDGDEPEGAPNAFAGVADHGVDPVSFARWAGARGLEASDVSGFDLAEFKRSQS